MNEAKALVQAYLHANGYFTVAELPVLRSSHPAGGLPVTRVDMLAYKPAPAASEPDGMHAPRFVAPGSVEPDPALCCLSCEPDVLVVEIGTGQPAARTFDVSVLAGMLVRFGCCGPREATDMVRSLLLYGSALTDSGTLIRHAAFDTSGAAGSRGLYLPLDHVARFVRQRLNADGDVGRRTASLGDTHGPAVVERTGPTFHAPAGDRRLDAGRPFDVSRGRFGPAEGLHAQTRPTTT